ncbi:hypothetical protein GGI04_002549 [Coemansia thaxteri]|uniref:Uncharacterized protein n=1 Tax=Coemansia thaxteri TaxID=2663907 RepID=A0A9W8BC58_9FUNG|nr:hypothetical protein H4R26_003755 [Coemansia thaxteri]KAJ2004611.1 hypothetical protein GGI04_002549 [Coemansia thaxteri]KAJ2472542.1 hypothetical protein GGI02_001505 [Coemansia sp. RSA 2322]KAJ2482238.1 hypothetical protein EV174_003261 [Coemansia sp. RSA 2320]
MRTFTAIAFAASAALAQEIGFTGAPSISSGTNGVSNPNVNNGWQSDSSLFSSGGSGTPNTFNNVVGSSFTSVNSNTAIKDNILNNPSSTLVRGNDGWTANGNSNALGPAQNFFGGAIPVFRRSGDVVFADVHRQANVVPHVIEPAFSPVFFAQPHFGSGFSPSVFADNVPFVKRSGDIVFADVHRQVNAAPSVAFAAPQAVPFGWQVAQPQFAASTVQPLVAAQPVTFQPLVAAQPVAAPAFAAPVSAEQNGQKASIVQNQA